MHVWIYLCYLDWLEQYWSLLKSLGSFSIVIKKIIWIRVSPLVSTFPKILCWTHSPCLSLYPMSWFESVYFTFTCQILTGNKQPWYMFSDAWAIRRLGFLFFLTSSPLPFKLVGTLVYWLGTESLGWGGVNIVPSGGILWELQTSALKLKTWVVFSLPALKGRGLSVTSIL